MSFKMNKKAVGKELLYFVATVFIIVLLVLFFLLSTFFSPDIPKITEISSIQKEGLISLLAFLNSKTEVDGQNVSMADIMRLAQADEKYKSKLEEESTKIFDPLYGKNVHLVLSSPSPSFYFEVLTTPYFVGEKSIINSTLPSYPNLGIWFGIGEKWKEK